MSYLWYSLIGTFVALFVGLLVSFATKPLKPEVVDSRLLAPFVRKLISTTQYPNQPEDEIIYAYGPPNMQKNGETVHNDNIRFVDLCLLK